VLSSITHDGQKDQANKGGGHTARSGETIDTGHHELGAESDHGSRSGKGDDGTDDGKRGRLELFFVVFVLLRLGFLHELGDVDATAGCSGGARADRGNAVLCGTFFLLAGFALGRLLRGCVVHCNMGLELEDEIASVDTEKNDRCTARLCLLLDNDLLDFVALWPCRLTSSRFFTPSPVEPLSSASMLWKTVGMIREPMHSASSDAAVCATVTLKNCSSRLTPPRKKDMPRTSNRLESILPINEVLTIVISFLIKAWTETISSTALLRRLALIIESCLDVNVPKSGVQKTAEGFTDADSEFFGRI
jgi:hypothetical protein